jgi:ferredoxin-NADP reductase
MVSSLKGSLIDNVGLLDVDVVLVRSRCALLHSAAWHHTKHQVQHQPEVHMLLLIACRCGPPGMMDAMKKHLDALGYSEESQFVF